MPKQQTGRRGRRKFSNEHPACVVDVAVCLSASPLHAGVQLTRRGTMTKKKDRPPEIISEGPDAPAGMDDLFVPLGNLGGKTIAHLREILDRGDPDVLRNYEDLTEDYIQTFNHAVTQGVPPEWALFAMTQAIAITMGQCLRAGLSYPEAAKFLKVIMDNARMSKDLVQQVTLLTPKTPGTKQ